MQRTYVTLTFTAIEPLQDSEAFELTMIAGLYRATADCCHQGRGSHACPQSSRESDASAQADFERGREEATEDAMRRID